MSINKDTRRTVYQKYGGRCAYCGREIEYQAMQIDHFIPQRAGGADEIENLMPACRMCNHYKRAHSLETFREYIQEIPRKVSANYIYKIGVAYGLVVERRRKPLRFYFEELEVLRPYGCKEGAQ
jgi:hypothetical protein